MLDLLKAKGINMELKGKKYWGVCPFHKEETPSFTVDTENQTWYCFGCQEGGDFESLLNKLDKEV